jgi:hypothetical protein
VLLAGDFAEDQEGVVVASADFGSKTDRSESFGELLEALSGLFLVCEVVSAFVT